MKIKSSFFVFLFIFFVSGCASVPFKAVEFSPVENINAEIVRTDSLARNPEKFEILSSVLFEYRGHLFSSLGYTMVDIPNDYFQLSGINQIGVTLFSVSAKGDEIVSAFAMEEFTKRGDFKQVVADVVKGVYFNLVPTELAKVEKRESEIIFIDKFNLGEIKYTFAGLDTRLIKKTYYENRRKIWTVYYYEYLENNRRSYPMGIIFNHHKYRYKITLRLKEIF